MPHIHHNLIIETSPEKVYEAITTQEGIAAWWCPQAIAKPEQGSIALFPFGADYTKEIEIAELKPSQYVKWICLKTVDEWIGTPISFELQPHAKGTFVIFHHNDWKDYTPMYAECSYHWALFMRSLKLYCETGTGRPSPNQAK